MVIEPMYATSDGRTDDGRRSPLNAPLGGGIITKKSEKTKQLLTQLYYDLWGIVVIEPMYATSDGRTDDGRRSPLNALLGGGIITKKIRIN